MLCPCNVGKIEAEAEGVDVESVLCPCDDGDTRPEVVDDVRSVLCPRDRGNTNAELEGESVVVMVDVVSVSLSDKPPRSAPIALV
jgi:hypothetical protein